MTMKSFALLRRKGSAYFFTLWDTTMEKAAPSEVKLGIIGGDLRALTAARELAARGFETALYGIDTCAGECGNVTKCAELACLIITNARN